MCTPERVYEMDAECRNCGHHFEAAIPKGTPVSKAEIACPVCEVKQVNVEKPRPKAETPIMPYVPPCRPYRPWFPYRYPHDYSWTNGARADGSVLGAIATN